MSPMAGKGRRGRHADGGGSRVPSQSPQRHQAQVTFAEVRAVLVLVLRCCGVDGMAVLRGFELGVEWV